MLLEHVNENYFTTFCELLNYFLSAFNEEFFLQSCKELALTIDVLSKSKQFILKLAEWEKSSMLQI